ncbi:unnamed protein product [Brassica rapa]|uniref:Uncharacterized protein n=1 Tax=Brassica campestris TaxID=3711 RepID=A0A3P6DF58_BRACM|nr:unnamed protein product [Brassica rapa]CAG7910164.1 unnamed protein product [Brassica rapa]VDC67947.1 unnamed protein product [Brassica rapa]VDD17729.1 unnamed protein product [Brassica rapa]
MVDLRWHVTRRFVSNLPVIVCSSRFRFDYIMAASSVLLSDLKAGGVSSQVLGSKKLTRWQVDVCRRASPRHWVYSVL